MAYRRNRWKLWLAAVVGLFLVQVLYVNLPHHECFGEDCVRQVAEAGDFCRTCSEANAELEGEPMDTPECEEGEA